MTGREKAESGLSLLKEAVLQYIAAQPDGASNAEVAEALGLHSDFEGAHGGYLSWSLLGILVNENRLSYRGDRRRRRYYVQRHPDGSR
jgi:uncharacterized protein